MRLHGSGCSLVTSLANCSVAWWIPQHADAAGSVDVLQLSCTCNHVGYNDGGTKSAIAP